MNINKLFKEANKIVSYKRMLPFFIILCVIGAVVVFSILIDTKMSNKDFFVAELNGPIYEIRQKPKNNYFLIGTKWYLIKDECIVNFSVDDSLNKTKNSYFLIVYDKQLKVKWQGNVKGLIFRQVNMPGR